jgi:ribonucleoside-diphosphate reductase alpha chain
MSSCFLLDSPRDELDSIYERYHQVAKLSKFAGGIGISWSRVRSPRRADPRHQRPLQRHRAVPATLDAVGGAVNQGGRRKGAACVYLEPWHPDIEEFLELRDNTGEDARRTHNLNLANWIPDEFMRRVEATRLVAVRPDGRARAARPVGRGVRRRLPERREGAGVKQVKARELYARMMRTLAQTGNGWMTFKDAVQPAATRPASRATSSTCPTCAPRSSRSPTTTRPPSATSARSTSARTSPTTASTGRSCATPCAPRSTFLDRVIDINYYPIAQAGGVNPRWRPVGLGLMGLQDVFFRCGCRSTRPRRASCPRGSPRRSTSPRWRRRLRPRRRARARTRRSPRPAPRAASCTRTTGASTPNPARALGALRERIAETGLRNSLLIAIAPTATIASIAGCYECIEPQVSNLFKRETLSGEFLQVNTYLVAS